MATDKKTNDIVVAPAGPLTAIKSTSGMTEEICVRLCAAVKTHPTWKTACSSLGISTNTVNYWIRMANNPHSHPDQAIYIQRIMMAQAATAAEAKKKFQELVDKGEAAAATAMLKYMNGRWKEREADDIDTVLNGGSFKADDLEKLLLKPTPRLIAILQKTGWYSINCDGLGWLAHPGTAVKDALDKNGLSVTPVIVAHAEPSPPEG